MANPLTKDSTESEIKAYFAGVLNLYRSNEPFPVDFDDVWQLVYTRRDKALSLLRNSGIFIQDIDYQSFSPNGGKLDGLSAKPVKNPKGGRPISMYKLSIPCFEFFIARKVRPVFEVYRKVFHRVTENGFNGTTVTNNVPMGIEETLSPLTKYYAQIVDRFENMLMRCKNNPVMVESYNRLRIDYTNFRLHIGNLVYVETVMKLEGESAMYEM